jgi:choline kinase
MKAIILSAGQGSRLLPLTEAMPKCLLPLGEETILSHQIHELAAAGIHEISVVTGFCAGAVEAELARLARPPLTLKTIFNPFYGVADNLGSCWIARDAMLEGDFLLVNGDTLFERAIPGRLLQASAYPVTLTIDQKDAYDSDDMKVALDGQQLVEVGKQLSGGRVDGESIGMSLYRGEGRRLFAEALEQLMRAGSGVRSWYLKAIDLLAQRGAVGVLSIRGLRWGEVDFPHDLARAQRLFAGRPELVRLTA